MSNSPSVVVIGGGAVGLCTVMLLAFWSSSCHAGLVVRRPVLQAAVDRAPATPGRRP